MAKVKEARRKRPDLWSRDKVLRLITQLGWDAKKFDEAYQASKGTRFREPRLATKEQVMAVKHWMEKGDDEALKKALGVKSQAAVDSIVRKAIKAMRSMAASAYWLDEFAKDAATGKSGEKRRA
jgi:hypothetical protein